MTFLLIVNSTCENRTSVGVVCKQSVACFKPQEVSLLHLLTSHVPLLVRLHGLWLPGLDRGKQTITSTVHKKLEHSWGHVTYCWTLVHFHFNSLYTIPNENSEINKFKFSDPRPWKPKEWKLFIIGKQFLSFNSSLTHHLRVVFTTEKNFTIWNLW